MGLHFPFVFRNKSSLCTIYIDSSTTPCYVFVVLKDQELIQEFGDEITVKTDFHHRLPKKDDYPALAALREALFDGMKNLPEFMDKRRLVEAISKIHRRDELLDRGSQINV